MKTIFIILVALFLLAPCRGRTITVDDDGPADFTSIQAAINDANDGDTVDVWPGIYTGDGNRDIDFQGKAITVRSQNGPDSCIIDCNGRYAQNHRGFYFAAGEDANSILEGFAIINGYIVTICAGGAGIYCNQSSPVIRNCIMANNTVELTPGSLCYCHGGAIYAGEDSNPQILACKITGNSVGDWGYGGAIYCRSGSGATIVNSLICKNTATGHDAKGGGIYADYHAALTIINCTLADNLAAQEGGAIYFYQYNDPIEMTIYNSILWANSPDQIYTTGPDNGRVVRCDVQGGWGFLNKKVDPLFANPAVGDYHLRSEAGRWDPMAQNWHCDTATSECIDFGLDGAYPGLTYASELWPHAKKINIGAYGGTPEASMSVLNIGNVADLNNDGMVNLPDFCHFAHVWQIEEILLAEDLNRDGYVDEIDLGVFVDEWLWQE
ncbi:MAG: right-handed parallel beta-helix repeat-containing protein [Planctomycetota bacterium]